MPKSYHTTTHTASLNVFLHRVNENYQDKVYCLGYKKIMGKLTRSRQHDGFYFKKDLKLTQAV